MNFLQNIAQRLLLIIQFILVLLFILFEEVIWEGLAKPIYDRIASLHILQRFEQIINLSNRYLVLLFFSFLLLGVEGAGLLAGLFLIQGKLILGVLLYLAKIPIAAFTFWLFRVAKSKLLSFDWFAWAYKQLMRGIEWLKRREIYKSSITAIREMKVQIKSIYKKIKSKYFAKNSRFITELKSFYRYIKNFKNRSSR